jgi:predicted nucleic acid-binding protein
VAVFVDTSALVCVAFQEPGHEGVAEHLASSTDLFASPLLEAEYRAALAREDLPEGVHLLRAFRWVLPNRPLSPELERVFSSGYALGAGALHLATALFLADRPADLPFLTLDVQQRRVAEELGFRVVPGE